MFRAIALGGGGVRAGLHLGALRALQQRQGHLQFPDGIWGCSAGAVLATGIAFNLPLDRLQTLFQTRLSLSTILPPLRLQTVADFPKAKGLFPMDAYTTELAEAFAECGLDIRTTTVGQAPVPLHILASNLTTQRITSFAGDVRLIDALRCSCCLPFVFTPQVLYGNVYVDGGVMVDCLASLVPSDCLVLHISETPTHVYPSTLGSMDLLAYLYSIYRASRTKPRGANVLWLRNGTVSILQSLTPEEKQTLIAEGTSQTLAFLAKRFPEEGEKCVPSPTPLVVDETRRGL